MPSAAPSAVIRARSAMRRSPCKSAAWPPATMLNSTASPSKATSWLCRSLPKLSSATGVANSARTQAPTSPSSTATRRSTVAVRATRCTSPEEPASAIWRTPL